MSSEKNVKQHGKAQEQREQIRSAPREQSVWGKCDSCGQTLPLIKETGMCGPCTFGEAETLFDD